MRRALACAVVLAALAPVARAGDSGLLRVIARELPRAERATGVQAQYDSGRVLEQALDAAAPVSGGCEALRRAALAFARGRIEGAEGIDRLREAQVVAGDIRARNAETRLRTLGRTCSPRTARARVVVPELVEPRSHAVAFGVVRAPFRGPSTLRTNGRIVARSSSGRFRVVLPAGRYDLEVRGPGGRVARSKQVWLLPASAARLRPVAAQDSKLRAQLAELGTSFSGIAAFSVRELATGRAAAWNEDARFPAASTVKLGVLAATLDRLGSGPRTLPELEALTGWSSNLAANRLVSMLGSRESVDAALRRLGARSSTYPGPYRIGTARADVIRQPPVVSFRLTTAGDLTRAMSTLHAAAVGNGPAIRRSGLTVAQARLALGLLLSSQRTGDNTGLIRPSLPKLPIAQKHGWISSARHTTAVVYGPHGPVALTVLTYRSGLTLAEAQKLGTAVTRVLGLT